MARLEWDSSGDRIYETGVDQGVLYPKNGSGVAWNGLIAVNESPSGAEATALYADNIKYLNILSAEDFGATIEAYSYPEEFKKCLGSVALGLGVYISQQSRKHFGFCYRTIVGNDDKRNDFAYKIHVVFSCVASPTERSYQTVNDSPEAITFSWEINAETVSVDGYKPTASLVLDSRKFEEAGKTDTLTYIENILYGSNGVDPELPSASEIIELAESNISYLHDSDDNYILDSDGNYIVAIID